MAVPSNHLTTFPHLMAVPSNRSTTFQRFTAVPSNHFTTFPRITAVPSNSFYDTSVLLALPCNRFTTLSHFTAHGCPAVSGISQLIPTWNPWGRANIFHFSIFHFAHYWWPALRLQQGTNTKLPHFHWQILCAFSNTFSTKTAAKPINFKKQLVDDVFRVKKILLSFECRNSLCNFAVKVTHSNMKLMFQADALGFKNLPHISAA